MIIAELVDFCNLKCALCWNRNREGSGKQMSLLTIKKIIKRYGNFRQQIAWFNWGEPLLYNEFESFSETIKETKSTTSSNFSLKLSNDKMLALCNFSTVCISLSGMTSDIYNIYNCGGNFDLVIKNVKKLSTIGCKRVILKWQSHRYNNHQFSMACDFAKEIGVGFESIPLVVGVEELINDFNHQLITVPKFNNIRSHCRLLSWPTIDVDGNYLLCCATHNIEIGYSIDDNIGLKELLIAKEKQPICITCRDKGYWRMY